MARVFSTPVMSPTKDIFHSRVALCRTQFRKTFFFLFVNHLAIISHLVTIKGIFQNHGEIVGQKVAGIYGFEIVYGTSSISDSRRLHLAMCIGRMAEWST